MPAFTLGVHQLPAAEVILIKTLIRLFAHDPAFRWQFVDAGPCDALIVEGTGGAAPPPAGRAQRVLTVTGASATPQPNAISRPIRAEQLQAWLKDQEHELRALRRAAESKPAAARQGLRYKLRRWPSAALLANDPQRIRLATLLTRRALGAGELSRISKLPREQCIEFVNSLRHAGLVEVHEGPRAPAPRPAHTPVAAAQRAPGLSLITSIRRHLGL